MNELDVEVVHRKVVSFAMEQAGFPIVDAVRVHNRSAARIDGLSVEITLAPDLGPPAIVPVPPVLSGDEASIGVVDVRLPPGRLRGLDEVERIRLEWRALVGEHVVATGSSDIELLPPDHWPGHRVPPGLLAAFVTPNDPGIADVLRRVGDRLSASTGDRSISGYQARSPARALAQVRALYETVQGLGVRYAPAPASFEEAGQKIRFPHRLLDEQLGNCLDVSLLFAACLEQMDLHPLVVLIAGHAFPGVWLVDELFPEQVVYDMARLRTGVALESLVFWDSSAAVADPPLGFDAACAVADGHLADDKALVWALDLQVARRERYRPLPMRRVTVAEPATPDEEGDLELDAPEAVDAPEPEPAPPPASVQVRFRQWKDKLLDLSLNNRLLHFRTDTKGSLRIDVPDVARFEDLLAAEAAFDLLPAPPADPRDERKDDLVKVRVDPEERQRLLRADLDRHRLHAAHPEAELIGRAVGLERAARTDLEEGGANTLYAVIGLLRWYDADASELPRYAPLLMVPVGLEYQRSTRRVRLRRLPDDPIANVTLVEKMNRDFAVDLSPIVNLEPDDSGVDVPKLLSAARRAVHRMPRWEVREEVFLTTLSFTKFLLWRDLDENAAILLQNPVVQHIAAGEGRAFPNPASEVFPAELDARPLAALPLVVDADSTQTAAVASALAGRSFVLQGPPGTGKSQTITNLIAAAIAEGKTVLFVAEKMAALEVVHRRLERAGLGDFCLELHSQKANKRAVTTSLAAALERRTRVVDPQWAARSQELSRLRDELNAYAHAIHAPTPLGLSFYAASARLLALPVAPPIPLRHPHLPATTDAAWRAVTNAVAGLATAARAVEPVPDHPWRDLAAAGWSSATEAALQDALDDVLEAQAGLMGPLDALKTDLGADRPADAAGLEAQIALATAIPVGPLPPAVHDERAWGGLAEQIRAFLDADTRRARARDALSTRWKPAWFERRDLGAHKAAFTAWTDAFFLFAWWFLSGRRTTLRAVATGALPTDRQIADDLDTTLDLTATEAAHAESRRALAEALGEAWDGDPASLDDLRRRGTAWRAATRAWGGPVPAVVKRALDADSPEDRRARLRALAATAHAALGAWRAAIDRLDVAAAAPTSADTAFADVTARATRWRGAMPALRPWALYQAACAPVRDAGFGAVVDAHRAGTVTAAALSAATERAFLERWVAARRDADPAIRDFDGANRHRAVAKFRSDDAEHLSLGATEVVRRLEARLPPPGGSDSSEPGILLREAKKKTRHKAVRKLLSELPHLLPRLKPCLLMSPMSVAQYLPATGRRFDLVVFDEASQICTHDAIGTLARGDQVIVVGDSRQLPPTAFFQRGDDTSDENDFVELPSILDEAEAAGLPKMALGWHYRSRHEALIAFSNAHYYDGKLNVFPAAQSRVPGLGVTWHPVNGVYDKGKTRTNRGEAEALVASLVASLGQYAPGTRSFGVVAFSQPQQTLVADLLDEARRTRPELEAHFSGDEAVFVKNLENVQGDERDEILFTVGYGPDEHGKIAMNFGPLNRDGGEKRLNVAVTRARCQLRVFSTLTHEQIDLGRTRAQGARHLKAFLRYVAESERPKREAASLDFDSDFERQVHDALVAKGWAVDSQVGCAGYRIDLGVVHPDRPGEYLLGVECDGAPYHSAATARDRDRLRQQVLEGLGWRMFRIWSTDWWFDRPGELRRLEEALDAAHLPAAPVVATAPAPATTAIAATPGVVAEPYVQAQIPAVTADPEWLHQRAADPDLRRVLGEVVRVEAPLHVEDLAKRVAEAFGIAAATKRVRRRVEEALPGVADLYGAWVWPPGVDRDHWTRFRAGAEPREADGIAPEEIAAAAAAVLRRGLSMAEEDLHRETARAFGISRLGARVREAMQGGADVLVARGAARRDGDRVVWTGDAPT